MRLLEPKDRIDELERVSDALRGSGQLERCRQALEQLLLLEPEHSKAKRLFASLSGHHLENATTSSGLQPTPFVLVESFLRREARDAIFEFMLSRRRDFEPARMNSGLYLDVRRTSFLSNCLNGLDARWRRILDDQLDAAFRAAISRLAVTEFPPTDKEVHCLIYRHGDFFRPHQDNSPGGSRALTFIYTLHHQPKGFSGGDLLLYDTHEDSLSGSGGRGFAATYTRIAPRDNRLILFPPNYFHEVEPVQAAAADHDARIAINGWFHRHTGE